MTETVRAAGVLQQTSLVAGQLLAKTALSHARTTVDGRQAIALLRKLAKATSLAALLTAETISALAHDDTAAANLLLEQAATHLSGTPSAVHRVGSALLRHEGYLHAQDRAARQDLGPAKDAVKVSEPQRQALASLARGDGVLRETGTGLREVVAPLAAYVSVRIATIDALASRDLLTLTPLPEQPGHYRLHVTPAGVHALLAANPQPLRSPPRSPVAVRPATPAASAPASSAAASRR
ncbi:hypothetical protein [Streptomyces sp. G1]|uniref:hypothetical protein n=1 Tax=Streptomyces sp. G1 TaxID=361572 RepID=UPI00202DD585|nr:hypothetical protein [Streptomyces sp. G1]MCM1969450.1 hypothetical protein [Streptomyces sp. G1]